MHEQPHRCVCQVLRRHHFACFWNTARRDRCIPATRNPSGFSIGNLIELIRDDRALLPFNRHVFLSKDEWYRPIFWPLRAECSDTPLKIEPESNQSDQHAYLQQSTEPFKQSSNLHNRQLLGANATSPQTTVHRRIEHRPILTSRLSLTLMDCVHWNERFSPSLLRIDTIRYIESLTAKACQRNGKDDMIGYRRPFDASPNHHLNAM